MGTFDNPFWTVGEVGAFYTLIFLIWAFLLYHLFSAGREAIIEIINFIKWKR